MTTPPSLLDPISLETPDSYVPYARRRNTPAQLGALQRLFEATPHPTRAQRQALADEFDMELKSVTNWFQNRRQNRKRSFTSNENDPPTRMPSSSAGHRRRRSKMPFDRSKISLDRIATLSERPCLTSQSNLHRMPLTPRKGPVKRVLASSPAELWTHMLSSPVVPPSVPDAEEVRLAALPSRAKVLYPLEWACLKARQKKWSDEDADGVSVHPALERCREVDEDGTEDFINPSSGATLSPQSGDLDLNRKDAPFSRPIVTPQMEDVEAAITLLGFKTRS